MVATPTGRGTAQCNGGAGWWRTVRGTTPTTTHTCTTLPSRPHSTVPTQYSTHRGSQSAPRPISQPVKTGLRIPGPRSGRSDIAVVHPRTMRSVVARSAVSLHLWRSWRCFEERTPARQRAARHPHMHNTCTHNAREILERRRGESPQSQSPISTY